MYYFIHECIKTCCLLQVFVNEGEGQLILLLISKAMLPNYKKVLILTYVTMYVEQTEEFSSLHFNFETCVFCECKKGPFEKGPS